MKSNWRELQARTDCDEEEPLRELAKDSSRTYSTATTCTAAPAGTASAAKEEREILHTGFALRVIGRQAMLAWLAFQAVGLVCQVLLWQELSGHLAEFESALARECAPSHMLHGICAGPMWNISAWYELVLPGVSWFSSDQDVVFTGASWSNSRNFDFATTSLPPTFLIVVVPVATAKVRSGGGEVLAEPVDPLDGPDLKRVAWSLQVRRTRPAQPGTAPRRARRGRDSVAYEDLSTDARQAMTLKGRVEWQATLTSRTASAYDTRFVVFIQDAATPHLAEVHASPQCAFVRSWKAFHQQHQGRRHRALSWCRLLLGLTIPVGCATTYAVHAESGARQAQGRFHRLAVAKFLLQDVPQQVCVVLYLFGWYEADGLRCQLCLFHPRHCDDQSAFHGLTLAALSCTLLSSLANQLLIRPVSSRALTEDDACTHGCFRAGSMSIELLPFTTGMCLASRFLIAMPTLVHVLVALPCAMGWLSLLIFSCILLILWCD